MMMTVLPPFVLVSYSKISLRLHFVQFRYSSTPQSAGQPFVMERQSLGLVFSALLLHKYSADLNITLLPVKSDLLAFLHGFSA